MAYYENQSDMFRQRAEKCKQNADSHYAQSMQAKADGDMESHRQHMAQSKHYYKCYEENMEKAKLHEGKTWK